MLKLYASKLEAIIVWKKCWTSTEDEPEWGLLTWFTFVQTPPPILFVMQKSSDTVEDTHITASPAAPPTSNDKQHSRGTLAYVCDTYIYISSDALWICMCGISAGHCMRARTFIRAPLGKVGAVQRTSSASSFFFFFLNSGSQTCVVDETKLKEQDVALFVR